jgi:putative colanic acid biosynthesis glycosyltransferase
MGKLLQICVEGNTGSTGTIAELIGQFMIQKGWESYIAYGRFPRPSKSNLIRIGSDFDSVLHGLETRFFDNHALGSRQSTKELIKKIEEINPDVIHLHHLHGYYINIEILFNFLHKCKIPVVWTFHDCWSFTGHCAYFDFVGCEKWKSECSHCPQKYEYPKSLLFDNSRKNFYLKKKLFTSILNMTIVSVSQWLNNLVSESFFKDTEHICIYNGIDLDTFKPINFALEIKKKYNVEDKFLILGVATTWNSRKGLVDFIELSKYLSKDELIILVGLNNQQIKRLPYNIIGLSRTDNRIELANLFATSDVFINLSIEETFGLTTAEALASGTPVIAYNRTASPELLSQETGFVVKKNDFAAIRKAISEIKKNGKFFYENKCRERACKLFDSANVFEAYSDLYNKVILNRK